MKIKYILKQPISRKPISANFVKSSEPKKMLINPVRTVASFDEKGKENIELWLAMATIATTILDTSTKALTRIGVIHKRDAVHDLVKAFKDLKKYFKGSANFDKKEIEIDGFLFCFLTGSEEHQNRVIKFQESILNKNK